MNGLQTIGPMERAVHLRALPLFDALRMAQVVGLAQLAEERGAAAGEVLQERGRPLRGLAVLLDGAVRVEAAGAAPVRVEAPHPLGVLELLADRPSAARLVAERAVTLLRIDAARWWDVLEEQFALVIQLRAALGRALAARQPIDVVAGPDSGGEAAARAPHDSVGRLLRLHRVPLLRPFGVAVLDALVRGGAVEHEIADRTRLLRAGEAADHFLVLTAGAAAATGARAPVGPGAVLGANAALSGLPHAHDVDAVGATRAIGVDVRRLWDLAEDHFHVARALLAYAARRLLALDSGPLPLDVASPESAEEHHP
ncbi:MAG: cyclic nucleotide-binding domain-containing protein [Deltaproteobacteria bacterium]|nr:cyclic nucleotide-binding domain-containing protein [Deltaproteobacteria bacterium]